MQLHPTSAWLYLPMLVACACIGRAPRAGNLTCRRNSVKITTISYFDLSKLYSESAKHMAATTRFPRFDCVAVHWSILPKTSLWFVISSSSLSALLRDLRNTILVTFMAVMMKRRQLSINDSS